LGGCSTKAKIKDLTLELLQRCYQYCIYCSSNSSSSQDTFLAFNIVKKIIDDFNELGGKVIELSGGEPLIYDNLSETINYINQYDIETHLFTCCYVPNKKIDYKIIENIDKIFVNLQAPNKQIHDYLTGIKGSFDSVIKFIKECKDRNKWVGTHIIPLKYNIDEIDEYIKLSTYLKIDNVSLLRYVKQGRGVHHLPGLDQDEILQLHNIIYTYLNYQNPQFKIGCPLDFQFIYQRKEVAKPCVSGIERCVIRPNGNVIPCPAFKDSDQFVAGNVNTASFMDIWEKGKIFETLRNFDYKKLKGFCKNCSFIDICRGRCHAQRIIKFGDIYSSPDPFCPLYLNRV